MVDCVHGGMTNLAELGSEGVLFNVASPVNMFEL